MTSRKTNGTCTISYRNRACPNYVPRCLQRGGLPAHKLHKLQVGGVCKLAGSASWRGQTEFQVNLKLGLTPCPPPCPPPSSPSP